MRIDDENKSAFFVVWLQDAAFSLTAAAFILKKRYGDGFKKGFIGIGAARKSIANLTYHQVYSRFTGQNPTIDDPWAATCRVGVGSTESFSMTFGSFPVGCLWTSYDFHVVEADVFILQSIKDMFSLAIYIHHVKAKMTHQNSKLFAQIKIIYGHLYIDWNSRVLWFLFTLCVRQLHILPLYSSTKIINIL